jgi:hypothetical protein
MATVEEFETLSEKLAKATLERNRLREENERLRLLLASNGVNPDQRPLEPPRGDQPLDIPGSAQARNAQARTEMSVPEKIALFRGLFRGRENIYALRWERDGDSGYSPAGIRDWKALAGPFACAEKEA